MVKHTKKRFILKWLKRTFIASIVCFISGWWVLPLFFSVPDIKECYPEQSSIIYDRNGKVIHHQTRKDYVRHKQVNIDNLPEHLVNATLASEDKRFWNHGGVDILASLRSLKDAIESGKFVSGASTITQQTIKLSTPRPTRNLSKKFKEAMQARRFEMKYSKEEILKLYFNLIEYGNRTQGPIQAAQHYFNKPLKQLSLAECALLAGLPQAPTRHNPRTNLKGAKERRNWILDRMAEEFDYSDEDIKRAKSEPIQLYPLKANSTHSKIANLIHQNKTNVITTIDLEVQEKVLDIVKTELSKLKRQNVNNAAVVVIHNPTGEIIALVGNPNEKNTLGGEYNAAIIPRSPGSALKPFTYLLGFENGKYCPASIIPDIPTWYASEQGPEQIVNFDRKHAGPVTIQRALGSSLNIPVVKVLNNIGGPTKFLSFLEKFGITTLNEEPSVYGLGLCIGAGEVTLLELTNAYASIARLGEKIPASLTFEHRQQTTIASADQCYLIAEILANNAARSHTFGTDSHLRLPFPCAVKTGTSTDYKDNFCVGFTKDFTVGVWVGNIDNTPMHEVSGVTGAGPIFYQTMLSLHEHTPPKWYQQPTGVQLAKIDPHTGKLLDPTHPRFSMAESVKTLSNLEYANADDYHDNTPLLDQRYKKWMQQPRSGFLLASTQNFNAPEDRIRVLTPTRNATYYLDPDLPESGATLILKASTPYVEWSCDTLEINETKVKLSEGTHHINVKCLRTNHSETIEFQVYKL